MKKLLLAALMSASLASLAVSEGANQKNHYKGLRDYFVLNSKGKSSLRGRVPRINCSEINSLSEADFNALLDTIDQSYECDIFDYLGSQDEKLCRKKYKTISAIVSSINDCRSIESYLYRQGCSGTEYGICSSLFKA